MTPLERLLAEELPTGLFGDAPGDRPTKPRRRTTAPARESPPSDPDAAAHRAALPNPYAAKNPRTTRRHLRAVPPTPAA
jgi:hypothetical protein